MTAQTMLTLGANTVIQAPCTVSFVASQSLRFGEHLGLLWLPLDADRHAACSPAYLHEPKAWARVDNPDTPCEWQLDLPALFEQQGVHFLQLIAYVYHDPARALPAVEMSDIQLSLNNDTVRYDFAVNERHAKAAIVLEIYQRGGQFKCRALGEISTQGLARLEQRVQISLDRRAPNASDGTPDTHQDNNESRHPRRVQAGDTWTGTAFAIDPYHLLTCHHVVESAALIGIRQQGQPDREAQVVLSDIGSDSAIIRVQEPLPSYLFLTPQCADILGESVTTLGFPLSGLSQQLQVTQGCISGLTGLGDDIRYLQFTAPIQPGSSGSPLLLPTGGVVGMVTATYQHQQAQNMNYAVKFQLLSALLTSAGIDLVTSTDEQDGHSRPAISTTPLSTPQLSKQSRGALWMVGCQG